MTAQILAFAHTHAAAIKGALVIGAGWLVHASHQFCSWVSESAWPFWQSNGGRQGLWNIFNTGKSQTFAAPTLYYDETTKHIFTTKPTPEMIANAVKYQSPPVVANNATTQPQPNESK